MSLAAISSRAMSMAWPRSSPCATKATAPASPSRAPEALAGFIAPKGSVALNGTSLTVNEVNGAEFGVNIIPHTKDVTTWGRARVGDKVNLEIDTLARYVARLQDWAAR